MEKITIENGIVINALLLSIYNRGKLFFAQERLCITDLENQLIRTRPVDLIYLIQEIL